MTAYLANASLGWRIAVRAPTFRWTALVMFILSAAAGSLFPSFLFFEDAQTRSELVASNLHLWTVVCACLLVPPLAVRISRQHDHDHGLCHPNLPLSDVAGRFVGLFGAYAAATTMLAIGGYVGIRISGDDAVRLAPLTAAQLLAGGVMIAGVVALSQIGTAAWATFASLVWVGLGTLKHVLGGPGSGVPLQSARVLAAWIPDLALLQPTTDSDTSIGTVAYAAALTLFYLVVGGALSTIRPRRRVARL